MAQVFTSVWNALDPALRSLNRLSQHRPRRRNRRHTVRISLCKLTGGNGLATWGGGRYNGPMTSDHTLSGPRVFISHCYDDARLAGALVQCLMSALDVTESDIRCTSINGHHLAAGDVLNTRIQADLRSARVVVAIVTSRTEGSSWVNYEIGLADGSKTPVIPVYFEGVTPSEAPLLLRHRVGLQSHEDKDVERLIEQVKKILGVRLRHLSRVRTAVNGLTAITIAHLDAVEEMPAADVEVRDTQPVEGEEDRDVLPDTTLSEEFGQEYAASWEILDWYFTSAELLGILRKFDLPRATLKADRIQTLLEEFGSGAGLLVDVCNKATLSDMCEALDLRRSGRKPELAERVLEHWLEADS